MSDELVLTASSWFQAMGKWVASISSDQLPPGPPDGSDLVGQLVTIEDDLNGQKPYRVVAVECCRVNHADQTKRCGKGYGLMVVPHTPYAEDGP